MRLHLHATNDAVRLRELFSVPQTEELWFSGEAELFHKKKWRRGIFVVFRTKIAFYFRERDSTGSTAPLLNLPISDMHPTLPPSVQRIKNAPLLRNADEPLQLWIPTTKGSPMPDTEGKGAVLRRFTLDPSNPKRVARLLVFLWTLEFSRLEEGSFEERAWKAAERDETTGQLTSEAELLALCSCLMFPSTTERIGRRGMTTLLNRKDPREEVDVVFGRFAAQLHTERHDPHTSEHDSKQSSTVEVVITNRTLMVDPIGEPHGTSISLDNVKVVYRNLVKGTPGTEAIRVLCSADKSGSPCDPWQQYTLMRYIIKAPFDIGEYYHALLLDTWLQRCQIGVSRIKGRLCLALESAVKRSAKGWNKQQHKLLRTNSLIPSKAAGRKSVGRTDLYRRLARYSRRAQSHIPHSDSFGPDYPRLSTEPVMYESHFNSPSLEPALVSDTLQTSEQLSSGSPPVAERATLASTHDEDDGLSMDSGSSSGDEEEQVPRFLSDATLSLQSTRRLLDHFASIDVSGDGDVQEKEFRDALSPLFRSKALPIAFFKAFDVDYNGNLSFVEFLTGMTMLLRGSGPDKLTFMFLLFDSDGDGMVCTDEFQEMLSLFLQLGGVHPSSVDSRVTNAVQLSSRLFSAIDKDRDGLITLVEFREALMRKRGIHSAFRRLKQQTDLLAVSGPQLAPTPSFLRNHEADATVLGHEDWKVALDLLDGMRESIREAPTNNPADVYCKTQDCFIYSKLHDPAAHPPGATVYTNYNPGLFSEIRKTDDISADAFLQSLGLNQLLMNMLTGSVTSLRQLETSGASGKFFLASHDDNFILMTIPEDEAKTLRRILPSYSEYLRRNPDTLLPRYYSLASLVHGDSSLNFVVMGNVLRPERPIQQLYDLKGVANGGGRSVPHAKRGYGVALKDLDLHRHINMDFEWHEQLMNQIRKDVNFLCLNRLSGYSFLCGIDSFLAKNPDGSALDSSAKLAVQREAMVGRRVRMRGFCSWLCPCFFGKSPHVPERRKREPDWEPVPVETTMKRQSACGPGGTSFGSIEGVEYSSPVALGSPVEDTWADSEDGDAFDAAERGHIPKRKVLAYAALCSAEHGEAPREPCETSFPRRTVFQLHDGGIPSSDSSEVFFVGFFGILSTGEDPEFCAKRLMSWLEVVLVRRGETQFVDVNELPGEIVFNAALESKTQVLVRIGVKERRLLLSTPPARNSGKVRLIEHPFRLDDMGFSLEKPVDKNRMLEVTLRHGPKVSTKGRTPYVLYPDTRLLIFHSLRDREEFCSVCALLKVAANSSQYSPLTARIPSLKALSRSSQTRDFAFDLNVNEGEKGLVAGLRTCPVKIFVGTWNVGNRAPGGPEDLNGWLGFGRDCAIAVIAAQECDYKPRKGFDSCEEDWFWTVQSSLNDRVEQETERFVMVDGITMWQMRLVVFAKVKHLPSISDCRHYREATGIAHIGGNKGGVAIGFKFLETPMLFVGCHLAAHQEHLLRRHSDIDEIIQGISESFGTKYLQVTSEFPHVYWMGDLNYRIDTKEDSKKLTDHIFLQYIGFPDKSSVLKAINEKRWDLLLKDDQLKKAMHGFTGTKQLLPHFTEAGPLLVNGERVECPNFPPTFKVFSKHSKHAKDNVQLDLAKHYQGFEYGGTSRVPSWCDRVLRSIHFSHRTERDVETERYDSCVTVVTSDHKPVYAVFSIKAREQYIYGRLGQPKVKQIVIQLHGLFARGLMPIDTSGKSDPYLSVFSSFTAGRVKTDAVAGTLNPHWTEVITLLPEVGDMLFLQSEYLYFSVADKDIVGSDEVLGQGVLCLEDYVGARATNSDFYIPLYCEGRQEGDLYGSIIICELPIADVSQMTTGTTTHRLPEGIFTTSK